MGLERVARGEIVTRVETKIMSLEALLPTSPTASLGVFSDPSSTALRSNGDASTSSAALHPTGDSLFSSLSSLSPSLLAAPCLRSDPTRAPQSVVPAQCCCLFLRGSTATTAISMASSVKTRFFRTFRASYLAPTTFQLPRDSREVTVLPSLWCRSRRKGRDARYTKKAESFLPVVLI